jgi:hypothetical protein
VIDVIILTEQVTFPREVREILPLSFSYVDFAREAVAVNLVEGDRIIKVAPPREVNGVTTVIVQWARPILRITDD